MKITRSRLFAENSINAVDHLSRTQNSELRIQNILNSAHFDRYFAGSFRKLSLQDGLQK